MSQRRQRAIRQQAPSHVTQPARVLRLRADQAVRLPLAFILLLFSFTLLQPVRQTPGLLWAFVGAGIVLLAWTATLYASARRTGRQFNLEISIRKQHYLQACAQSAVFVYWGWYWRTAYDYAYLIAAQLIFAYAFDTLLSWSRRDTHVLGFGPFPIIFSTNLFLWFKPDWFAWQFVMVGLGFAAKELIRWTKDGRRAHIFNPSSFPLSVFSLVLLATGASHLTWGEEIAYTQLIPPYIYVLIFLVSLPGQFLFGVASMTLAAVTTTYVFGLVYFMVTGTYFFLGPSLPIAVFLGMHLLFTDPSTSPRTELGRLLFGVLYGLSVVALFALLERFGAPSFYDKLLGVPILNLSIQGIDRLARLPVLQRLDPAAIGRGLSPRRRHVAYMAVWALVFLVMQAQTSTEETLARGDVLLSLGRIDEAIGRFQEVVRAEADHPLGQSKLGLALSRAGRFQEALPVLQRAAELQPEDPDVHINLGSALVQAGRLQEAVPALERALQLRPEYAEARYNLAHAYTELEQPTAAARELREALRLRPEWPPAMGVLAWLQATHPDAGIGAPEEAIQLASRAADLSGRRDASILDALAAAYAAAGRFADATRTAEEAEALALRSSPQLAADIKARLSLYRAGQPLVASVR
jgi:tetratricopeptide (TPR) repeat protein